MLPVEHAAAILQSLRDLDVEAVCRALDDPGHTAYAHADALADAADSADEHERSAGIHALFADLVEVLNDSFAPASREIYARLFPRVLYRSACREPALVAALRADGVGDERALAARYAEVRAQGRRGPGQAPWSLGEPRCIAVLSRVTIGADILLVSIVLQRLHQRFPQAALHLLGDAKLQGLLGGLPGVVVDAIGYPRRGPLRERLRGWLQVRQQLRACAAELVISPDSRLDQLGIMPLLTPRRHLLWENLQDAARAHSLADLLDRWLSDGLGLPADPPCLPRLGLDVATARDSQRIGDALGRGPWVAVKFDHGGNPAKALPRAAEVAILRALRKAGWRILIDRGFGAAELATSDSLMQDLGLPVRDVDDSGQDRGEAVARAEPRSWADAQVVRFHGSIAGWAAAVCQCRLAVSYDSVGHHLAAAAQCPVIVAFTGFTDERFPIAWQPRGSAAVYLTVIPTERRQDPREWQRIIDAIPPAADAYAPRECE